MFIIIRLLLRARLSWEFRDKTQLAPIIQTKLRLKNKGYKFTCRLRNQPNSFTFFYQGKITSAIVSPFQGECSRNQYPPPP